MADCRAASPFPDGTAADLRSLACADTKLPGRDSREAASAASGAGRLPGTTTSERESESGNLLHPLKPQGAPRYRSDSLSTEPARADRYRWAVSPQILVSPERFARDSGRDANRRRQLACALLWVAPNLVGSQPAAPRQRARTVGYMLTVAAAVAEYVASLKHSRQCHSSSLEAVNSQDFRRNGTGGLEM